ncbi:shikimate O-hydroxycinnamoyltransferase-like, partial [Phalaenopsis equestris]|uniref:shikimate O-hydroxycinnamoyltransferase-like n=1 Tax=Phalaenopsis equestris TaxID=78828 RepID=UPI0009E3109A
MVANTADKYSIKICHKELIAAENSQSLKEHFLPLSNLDLLLPPIEVGLFLCYKKPPPLSSPLCSFASLVAKLKSSLAKALAVFYPFAGKVLPNAAGEPALLCNNRGVVFIEAYAEVALDQLNFYDVDRSVERKLVPKNDGGGVLAVQATEMECGGLVLGCAFDHRISDAYTFHMFLTAWAEMAASKELSISPIFDRSLLNPGKPTKLGSLEPMFELDRLYGLISQLPPPPPPTVIQNLDPQAINRLYYIPAKEIDRLQFIASSNGRRRRTKIEAFTAYLWKLMGRVGKAGQVSRMGVVVDGRRRLGAPEMSAYFGNVLSIPYGSLGVEEVEGMGIAELSDYVHEIVVKADSKEHFKGL